MFRCVANRYIVLRYVYMKFFVLIFSTVAYHGRYIICGRHNTNYARDLASSAMQGPLKLLRLHVQIQGQHGTLVGSVNTRSSVLESRSEDG